MPDNYGQDLRIAYIAVHDVHYPRNREIREYISQLPGAVVRTSLKRPLTAGIVRRSVLEAWDAWNVTRGANVVILAEFTLRLAAITWVISRIRRAVHVVDNFVGLYETWVEDVGRIEPGSLQARLMKLTDSVAALTADISLVDTDVRGETLSKRFKPRGCVMTIPVGAPAWSVGEPITSLHQPLRLLYYGNYINLHGLPFVVEALALARQKTNIRATFVGSGSLRDTIAQMIKARGLDDVCTLSGPVPEADLASLIAEHDVVLGIFGTSPKAATVIANKVWQGLACERIVITRQSEAFAEIAQIVRGRLITVPGGDSPALAREMSRLASADISEFEPNRRVSLDLRQYAQNRLDEFVQELRKRVDR